MYWYIVKVIERGKLWRINYKNTFGEKRELDVYNVIILSSLNISLWIDMKI